jgi:hypothetical protein
MERVFYVETNGVFSPPPKPMVNVFAERLLIVSRFLDRHLPSTARVSYDQFINYYTGRKRTVYAGAVQDLECCRINKSDAEITAFEKAEKTNQTLKPLSAPRLISPRGPRYCVELGRYIKPIEGKVYRTIARLFNEKTVMKGMNAKQVGSCFAKKWGRYRKPVAVGLDARRFDQHVSKDALIWEHARYLSMFTGVDKIVLSILLSWQLTNTCVGYTNDGKIKYTVDGCRMSGDMNTGLGNCLLMCAMVYAYCYSCGITKFSLANNGDDCVVIMEAAQLDQFIQGLDQWFLDMGFSMKVEDPVYELEQVEFCQAHPVFDGTQWVMVRTVPVSLAKDCISIKPLDSKGAYTKWVAAIGQGGLSLTGGIPVCQNFYLGLIRASEGATAMVNDPTQDTGFYILARGMERHYSTPTPEARVSFYIAFGILPDEQEAIEHYYDTHTPFWSDSNDYGTLPYIELPTLQLL